TLDEFDTRDITRTVEVDATANSFSAEEQNSRDYEVTETGDVDDDPIEEYPSDSLSLSITTTGDTLTGDYTIVTRYPGREETFVGNNESWSATISDTTTETGNFFDNSFSVESTEDSTVVDSISLAAADDDTGDLILSGSVHEVTKGSGDYR